MPSIPHLPSTGKICHLLTFSLLQELYPRDLLASLLTTYHAWGQRERKLNQVTMIYLLIVWSLWTCCSLRRTADRLLAPVRWNRDEPVDRTPSSGAFCSRRQQLGVRVLRALFQEVCHPLAGPKTSGCFAFGLRLMGIDGTTFSVAESPLNQRCFRRSTPSPSPTPSPFPLLQAVLLVEIGTHAIVDAIAAMIWATERRLARGVLRQVQQGMLILLDRGFFSAAFLQQLVHCGAHVLGRLPSNCLLQPGHLLRDGSRLITLPPTSSPALSAPLSVRVLSYRIQAKAADQLEQVTPSHSRHGACTTNPDVKQVHRLVTTLLDPDQYRPWISSNGITNVGRWRWSSMSSKIINASLRSLW